MESRLAQVAEEPFQVQVAAEESRLAQVAVVGNDLGEILLIQRGDSGFWLYPTGWADVGYSASEVIEKEVLEETGLRVEPTRLIALFDGLRRGYSHFPFYSLVFQCRYISGELEPHPLECSDLGWFSRDKLPSPLAGADRWVDLAFAAIEGKDLEVFFDLPREPIWRSDEKHPGQ